MVANLVLVDYNYIYPNGLHFSIKFDYKVE